MADIGDDKAGHDEPETQRLDKWLWFARMLKSRTLAAQLVADGKVRINRSRVTKPSQTVRIGDVLTIALRGRVQILKVMATGYRRGPPAEATRLYEAIETREAPVVSAVQRTAHVARREPGSGRPSKRDRRLTDRLTEPE